MKIRNYGLVLLACGMLFAGGCSKEEAKKKAEDLKLEDLTIVLHDENITIYQPLGDLLDIWELDQAPEHIEALGHDMVFLTYKDNDRESMILRVFNPKDEEISVNDALIQRVVFSDRNTENVKEYKLPHNFKIGSTTEQDVIKALGTPYEYRISNDDSNMDYVTGTSYETSELAEFSFEKGKLSKVVLSGSEKRKEKKENISFDTAKAVGYSVYDIPFAKGSAADEFAKGSIQFDGVSINKTTPAKALIEKGWKSKYLDEYNKKETTISAEKSDMRIDLRVDGTISSTDQLTEKHVIQEIFAADESLEALTFASGVNGTSTLQDVYQVLGKPMSVRYSKNGVRVRYRTESNTAVSMSFKTSGAMEYCSVKFDSEWE